MYLTARGKTRDTLKRERNAFPRRLEMKGTANTYTQKSKERHLRKQRGV